MKFLPPLKFQPKLLPKIWGGEALREYGRNYESAEGLGESWDIYDRPGDSALVAEGPEAGRSLQSLLRGEAASLLGERLSQRDCQLFPLMLKLIDAREPLSVQVHPDDAQARRLPVPEEYGKSEFWYVLSAAPGARLIAGLKEGVGRRELEAALQAGNPEPLLESIPVKAGDSLYLPAGCVHALGKGCVVAEVQQNSDTTWRLYDYGRLEKGRPRALHLNEGLAAIHYELPAPRLLLPESEQGPWDELLHVEAFRIRHLKLQGRFKRPEEERTYGFFFLLEGALLLLWEGGEMTLKRGESVLLPASLDWSLESRSAEVLWTLGPSA